MPWCVGISQRACLLRSNMDFKFTCSTSISKADVEQFYSELFPSIGINGKFIVEDRYVPDKKSLKVTFSVRFLNEKDEFIAALKSPEWSEEELEETYLQWFAYEFAKRVNGALTRKVINNRD